MKFRLTTLSIALFIILLTSCHKQNTSINYNEIVETTNDYVIVQQMNILLLNTYFKAINDSTLFTDGENIIDGAKVTLNSDSTSIKIQYNSWGNDDGYGYWRTGSYTATTNADFFSTNSIIDIQFNNFSFDFDSIVSSGIKITNNAADIEGNKLYLLESEQMERHFHDSTGKITYNFNQNIVYKYENASTYYSQQDIIETSGEMAGTARNSRTFNVSTDSPILGQYFCSYFNGGISTAEVSSLSNSAECTFYVDICSNTYIMMINGMEFQRGY